MNIADENEKPQSQEQQPEPRKNQATELLQLCGDFGLFHTEDEEAFAVIRRNSHVEAWPIRSPGFRQYLSQRYFQTKKKVASSHAIQDALSTLAGQAKYEGKKADVFTRLAKLEDRLYLDLADPAWQRVEVTASGWSVVAGNDAILFRRSKGMKALPIPVKSDGSELARLRGILNIGNDDDWHLLLAWLLGALNAAGPFPILVLQGEQGSCKSTTAMLIRSLIDPNTAPLRNVPRSTEDLMIAAKNAWIIALDNLSGMPPWLSDDLCRVATGGSLSKRELFTDGDEVILSAKRPCILTGIDDLLTRGDLADRAISIHLPVVPESKRRTEAEVRAEFEKLAPAVLGVLLDAASRALRDFNAVSLRLPRMADFARWVTAGETAFGFKTGMILSAYARNQANANTAMLENSAIAPWIMELADPGWSGTASELLSKLNAMKGSEYVRQWPANARVLSDWLRRLAPALRKAGVDIQSRKEAGSGSRKIIAIAKAPQNSDASDAETQTEPPRSGAGVARVAGVAEKQHLPNTENAHTWETSWS